MIRSIWSVIATTLLGLIETKTSSWLPRLASKLLDFSATKLPLELSIRLQEEWQAMLMATPGNMMKLVHALDIMIRGAPRISHEFHFPDTPYRFTGFLRSTLSTIWKQGTAFILDRITEKKLKPLFEKSHSLYWEQKQDGVWRKLTEDLEYKLHTITVFDLANGQQSIISIRKSPDSDVDIISATLVIRGDTLNGQTYKVYVSEYDISKRPKIIEINNMPLFYYQLEVYIEEIILSDGKRKNNIINGIHHYVDYFNTTFIWRWGKWWNIDLYTEAKAEFLIRVGYTLGTLPLDIAYRMRVLTPIRRFSFYIISISPITNSLFWTLLIFNLIHVCNEGRIINNIKGINSHKIRKFLGIANKVTYSSEAD